MAGYKNSILYGDENGKLTGEMGYERTIAQIIADKTGRTTYAYVNYTSQKK